MTKISVILPVYNVEKFVSKCLDSVINQTLTDIEIICINDGSPDKSAEIIKEYSKNDSRIILINQKNKGAGVARNAGLKIAKGQFVIFMDPDDYYPENNILEILYNAAVDNNVKIAGGEVGFFFDDDSPLKQDFSDSCKGLLFEKSQIVEYKDYQFDYGFTRFIYDRNLLKGNNIVFPALRHFEDPVFFAHAMQAAKKFYALKKIVYAYRTGPKFQTFNKKNSYDALRGLIMNLKFAKRNNLSILEDLTVTRLEEHFWHIEKYSDVFYLFKFCQLVILNKKTKKLFYKVLSSSLKNIFPIGKQ